MINPDTIQEVISRLVKTYNPLEIYLFGSYAYGTPHDNSDLDLLVVIESSEEKWHQRVVIGLEALWGMKISKDLLIYTKEEFNNRLNDDSTLAYHVKNKGKRLYARA